MRGGAYGYDACYLVVHHHWDNQPRSNSSRRRCCCGRQPHTFWLHDFQHCGRRAVDDESAGRRKENSRRTERLSCVDRSLNCDRRRGRKATPRFVTLSMPSDKLRSDGGARTQPTAKPSRNGNLRARETVRDHQHDLDDEDCCHGEQDPRPEVERKLATIVRSHVAPRTSPGY
jgi:hypothetical protein